MNPNYAPFHDTNHTKFKLSQSATKDHIYISSTSEWKNNNHDVNKFASGNVQSRWEWYNMNHYSKTREKKCPNIYNS